MNMIMQVISKKTKVLVRGALCACAQLSSSSHFRVTVTGWSSTPSVVAFPWNHIMTAQSSITPELLYCLYRFTSCPFITRFYIFGNHGHICEDCKCIRCVVLRWVRSPNCNCRLPPPREGLSLDARIRKKRLACGHEPKSVPIFPPQFCFCVNPEKKNCQVAMAIYSDEDSDSTDHEEENFMEPDGAHASDKHVRSFGELRRI